MSRIKYFWALLAFCLFVPTVYAFTYDINVQTGNTSVSKGSVQNITLSLGEIKAASGSLGACSFVITYDDGILLQGNVKSLGTWSMMGSNNKYILDTGDAFVSNAKLISMSVKVNATGSVKFTEIECSDGETKEKIADKAVSFTVSEANSNVDNSTVTNNTDNDVSNNSDNNTSSTDTTDSGIVDDGVSNMLAGELNIIPNEGEIDFDPEVYEYTVKVKDMDSFDVQVTVGPNHTLHSVERRLEEEPKKVIVSVVDVNDSKKEYVINVVEVDEEISADKKNNYIPIFIGIICLLVFINVFRLIRNIKK